MSSTATIDDQIAVTDQPASAHSRVLQAVNTFVAASLSSYFVLAACSLYWITAAGGWLIGKVLPRVLIERAPLVWLCTSVSLMAAATQTVPGFFPDYGDPRQIAAEITLWFSIALFARSYLIYIDYPPTFDALQRSIESRPVERWMSGLLHHPIDAIFTRIWLANSIAMIPLTLLVILPDTLNYFVIAAYGVAILMAQFPHDLADHTNIHTRIFQPKLGASPRTRLLLIGLQFYFENVLSMLVARSPHFYRVQHVHVHHVEGNGPLDSQSTEPYDRTSFLDFSRHAFRQGVHLTTGYAICRYLSGKGKLRLARDLIRGLVIWYVVLIAIAMFNPLAAVLMFINRFIGGNILSLVAFWQHGLIDPDEAEHAHGNSIDYEGAEHGNLGNDYHVEHHIQPGRHWSAYYKVFTREAESDGGHAAIVMHKEMFSPLTLVAALWRKDYAAVACHAKLGGVAPGNQAELDTIVRQRTRPIGARERTGPVAWIDRTTSSFMSRALPARFHV